MVTGYQWFLIGDRLEHTADLMLYTVLTMTLEMSNHGLAVYTLYLELTGFLSE